MTTTLIRTMALAGFGVVCGCSGPADAVDAGSEPRRDPSARRPPVAGTNPDSDNAPAPEQAASGSALGQAGGSAPSGGKPSGGKPITATATPRVGVPEPEVAPSGTRQLWEGYSFIVPPTMTGAVDQGSFLMFAPADVSAGQGNCAIALLPETPAAGDLVTQALGILNTLAVDVYGGILREGGLSATRPPNRGVSGAGWRYAFVRGELLSVDNAPTGTQLRVLLVGLGATVAAIVGIESADNPCLDELNAQNLTWQALFYSLDFPAFTQRDPTLLARQAIGWWFIGGNTVGLQEIYAANGRYANTTTLLKYEQYSPTEVLQTATSFSGEGGFSVTGDRLTRFPDGGPAKTSLFRIMEEMNSVTPGGWLPRLYQLQVGDDGSVSEYALTWRRD